ncbi:2-polyprenyl-6-methoxyphenol hydroxylase related FAD-dependent oxidoreductase [Planoprotostelium fungivorum]|uniref:2-polyprenyl-6-methoxyphenol hydroxylase related FAD-dependent oxidoreductase n=1 Tax=Planoprotostelium fungivorum TaxID=1890364 RepID=A0A2P6MT26_9EUKA|nr:2-polyprenyl-6-methoxyphenol hydroxylase related FAD-dependent oxidoreductase [Planoprotostelium fungivorum]
MMRLNISHIGKSSRSFSTSHYRKPSILISGAGPSGLVCALTLKKRGIDANIVDLAPNTQHHRGVGIVLQPNATQVLKNLGIFPAIHAAGQPLLGERVVDRIGGNLTFNSPYRSVQGVDETGDHIIGIDKQTLCQILSEGLSVRRQTGIVNIHKTNVAGEMGYKVALKKSLNSETYNILIGADSISSKVRSELFEENAANITYPGWGVAYVKMPRPTQFDANNWLHVWARGRRLVVVPVDKENVFAWTSYRSKVPVQQIVTGEKPVETIAHHFSSMENPFAKAVASEIGTAILGRVWFPAEVTMKAYTSSHAALIGDAAFAMAPYMLQGVGLGVESGYLLGSLIANAYEKGETYESALEKYNEMMIARVKIVRTESNVMGSRLENMGDNRLTAGYRKLMLNMSPPGKKAQDYLNGNPLTP